MCKKIQNIKWQLHQYKYKQLLLWGLKNGFIMPYNNSLIEKLRNVYYAGIPASIILLCDGMTNGYCYDRALLMSRALLDDEDDVQLVYATIDSIRLNPRFICDRPLCADHCIVERTNKDGNQLIYDTTAGFIFDKRLYWLMENPKVRKINSKESIKKFIEADEERYPLDIERDKYASPLILPFIEMTYGRPNEMYSQLGIELLQREIEHFKEKINYAAICQEINEDMIRVGVRKRV